MIKTGFHKILHSRRLGQTCCFLHVQMMMKKVLGWQASNGYLIPYWSISVFMFYSLIIDSTNILSEYRMNLWDLLILGCQLRSLWAELETLLALVDLLNLRCMSPFWSLLVRKEKKKEIVHNRNTWWRDEKKRKERNKTENTETSGEKFRVIEGIRIPFWSSSCQHCPDLVYVLYVTILKC